jgi:hypothetical protein
MKKGLVLVLVSCLILFFLGLAASVLGWVRLNRVDGKMFVVGQPFFYTVLDSRFVEQSLQGNIEGLSSHIGVGPTGYENYKYFSGVVLKHDEKNKVVDLVGRGMRLRLGYGDDFVARFLDKGQPLPVQTKDVLLLEKSIAKGNAISVLFDGDFVINQFVFIRND